MSIQDLISVSYVDNTNYPPLTSGEDVLGAVFFHHWGPADKKLVLDRTQFFELYPESMPLGTNTVDIDSYQAYAAIKKAFDAGISKVEVYRFAERCKYFQWELRKTSAIGPVGLVSGSVNKLFAGIDPEIPSTLTVALKYPGRPPQSLVNGDMLSIRLGVQDDIITIDVLSKTGETYSVLEHFEGGLNPTQVVEGQNYYITNVVKKSQFITVNAPTGHLENFSAAYSDCVWPELQTFTNSDYAAVKRVYSSEFSDIETSQATMLISPFIETTTGSEIDNTLITIATECQERIAVIGLPKDKEFTAETISEYRSTLTDSKFGVFVAGREQLYVFGLPVTSNCIGGWCGRTAATAKEVRINQLASAKTYGAYPGTLTETLSFNELLPLHDEQGIISVYNANTGPTIFGVRSMNAKQTSYFGKANIIRVITALLKQIFPMCIDSLHTDVAANAQSRASFENSLNSIVNKFIANQNLKADSIAICDESINSDTQTNGGEVLNVVLSLHFIKLTERINIKIVATDSSVSAEII